MRRIPFPFSLATIASAFGFAAPALADDDDYPVWKPSNDTATAVTGPISCFPSALKRSGLQPLGRTASSPQFKPEQGPMPARISS